MTVDLHRLRQTLSPTGVLRAAINYGNPVLAQTGPNGEPQGVSVALARALAQRLDANLEFVSFNGAGKVVDCARDDVWDIGFLAIDPMRAQEVSFTSPYVVIEGTYLVRIDSGFKSTSQLDADGISIAVGKGAAYDLYLSRSLQRSQIVRAETSAAAIHLFLEQRLDAAAGVRQPLEEAARKYPGLKVLPDSFTAIRQAMATPVRNAAAIPYLQAFIDEMIASGLVDQELQRVAE